MGALISAHSGPGAVYVSFSTICGMYLTLKIKITSAYLPCLFFPVSQMQKVKVTLPPRKGNQVESHSHLPSPLFPL